jgi:hypothetical protein
MCICLKTCSPLVKKQALLTRTAIHSLIAIVSFEDINITLRTVLAFLLQLRNPFHRQCFTLSHRPGLSKKYIIRLLFFFIASYFFIKFTKFPA